MALAEVLANIKKRVEEEADPAKLAGLDAVFQFEVTGDEAGVFHAKVADQKAEIVEAAHDNPNVTIIMNVEDLGKLVAGELNATSAFMAGKLKIKGDMSLAMKLQSIIG
ncbi:MAG TPA: SCP2 sterol-binding domain-containing protein [Firmicutes bacterium]|jgi:putative sterol carrier protein|nr:SCP2 sterol-binding domain-containing protein [Bacillota bacterium]